MMGPEDEVDWRLMSDRGEARTLGIAVRAKMAGRKVGCMIS